jgi:calcium-dependent protein kinase
VSPNQEFEYLGEDKVLRDLKERVALYVFQTKIQDEYMAETIIDKGSYAVVLELINIYTKKAFAAKCIDQKKILDKPNAPVIND